MSLLLTRLACVALLGAAVSWPCRAESFASSASSAGSASVGSLSDSLRGSSNSSTRRDVAEGDYRVIEVAAAERPGWLRLRLQPAAGAPDELVLELPPQALAPRGLAAGDTIRAQHRPYGVELARADTREPFFLLLTDDWQRELDPHAVTL